MITYDGNEYYTRSFRVTSKETGVMDITIAPESLEGKLLDENSELVSEEAEAVDEQIYFYLDDELLLNTPAAVICKSLLDQPFTLVKIL